MLPAAHGLSGVRCTLGLRGATLAAFAKEQILEVIDMSPFVAAQRPYAQDDSGALSTPLEHVYVQKALENQLSVEVSDE